VKAAANWSSRLIDPIEHPDNPIEVWRLTIEADDEEGIVTELGRFEDLGSAKLHASRTMRRSSCPQASSTRAS
jgi:hypothetical protein